MARKTAPKKRRAGGPQGSVIVIGLGRFGRTLALELVDEDTEVLGIDENAEVVQAVSGSLTHAVRTDSTKEDALRQLGVHEFDRAVVAIGTRPGSQHPHGLAAHLVRHRERLGQGHQRGPRPYPHPARCPPCGLPRARHGPARRPPRTGSHARLHRVRGRLRHGQDQPACRHHRSPSGHQRRPLPLRRHRRRYQTPGEGFTCATPETVVEADDTIIVAGRTRATERFSELQ
ncbi:NAD-binding protein [Streptomyces sp. S1A(2023)]